MIERSDVCATSWAALNQFWILITDATGSTHLEVGDRVDRDRHVVLGDHLLRRDRHGLRLQVDLPHLVEERDDVEEAGSLGADAPAQPEDHSPFVLLDDAKAASAE